jgi:hypothetical protein
MSKSTELSRGHITAAHELTITLEEPDGAPSAVLIHWPAEATVTTEGQLKATIASVYTILAQASVRLARLKAKRRGR